VVASEVQVDLRDDSEMARSSLSMGHWHRHGARPRGRGRGRRCQPEGPAFKFKLLQARKHPMTGRTYIAPSSAVLPKQQTQWHVKLDSEDSFKTVTIFKLGKLFIEADSVSRGEPQLRLGRLYLAQAGGGRLSERDRLAPSRRD
jgi:hypothetical protein